MNRKGYFKILYSSCDKYNILYKRMCKGVWKLISHAYLLTRWTSYIHVGWQFSFRWQIEILGEKVSPPLPPSHTRFIHRHITTRRRRLKNEKWKKKRDKEKPKKQNETKRQQQVKARSLASKYDVLSIYHPYPPPCCYIQNKNSVKLRCIILYARIRRFAFIPKRQHLIFWKMMATKRCG